MSLSIGENISASYHRVSRLWSLLCALVESFLDRWNVLVGHIISYCSIFEHAAKICIGVINLIIYGLHIPDDFSVLTSSSTLLLVQIVERGFSTDGLSIVYCRIANDQIDIVLTLHSFAIDEEM